MHLSQPPGGRSHPRLFFLVCPNPCPQEHAAGTQPADSPAGLGVGPRERVWKASPNSQGALRSAAQPSAGRFPGICSQVTGDPADPGAACRSPGMFSSLHGPCHSDHMLVRLPKPGHRTQSNNCTRLTFWDSQRAAETDTETPMQEQGKDQNGNGDIWHNSSDANGYDLTRF